MPVIIVDPDGQTFVSPVELDNFDYYRDYLLVRTYKEFFGLNPQILEETERWEDVSGPSRWTLTPEWDHDDQEYDAEWYNNEIIITILRCFIIIIL